MKILRRKIYFTLLPILFYFGQKCLKNREIFERLETNSERQVILQTFCENRKWLKKRELNPYYTVLSTGSKTVSELFCLNPNHFLHNHFICQSNQFLRNQIHLLLNQNQLLLNRNYFPLNQNHFVLNHIGIANHFGHLLNLF